MALQVADALAIHAAIHSVTATSVTLLDGSVLQIERTAMQGIPHCEIPATTARGVTRIIAQSLSKSSKSSARARNGAEISWIMTADLETGAFTRGAGWGRIEDGHLETNSTASLDQTSVKVWRKANPKVKKAPPAAGSVAALVNAAAKQEKKEKKEKKRKREEDAVPLPDVVPNFALTRADAMSIALALHCDAQPDSVELQATSTHEPQPRALEIKRTRNAVRRCDVIVDHSRPRGYCKLMTQNVSKGSEYARRAREEGAEITWILPLDAAGKHTHNSTWGRIADGVLEKMPRPALI